MFVKPNLLDIYSFDSSDGKGNWTGDTDPFVSRAVNLCNLTRYEFAYASDGLNIADLIQGANQWGIKELSVDNLKQYISSELQKRTVPLSDVKVTSDVSTVNVEIKVSNKKANIVQFSNDI